MVDTAANLGMKSRHSQYKSLGGGRSLLSSHQSRAKKVAEKSKMLLLKMVLNVAEFSNYFQELRDIHCMDENEVCSQLRNNDDDPGYNDDDPG